MLGLDSSPIYRRFYYYWFHRVSHESIFLGASHLIHHSSLRYNLSTTIRQTWSGGFYTFTFWLPLILIGFHPVMVLVQMSISLIY
nr:sterol desaturase family protein [uncultured Polaribacter sp.]